MIIVEGPDGAGKSTVVRELSEKLGLPIAPRVVSAQTKAMVNLKQWTDDNLKAGFQEMIFDRHRLISDPIYRFAIPEKRVDPGLYEWRWLSNAYRKFRDIRPLIIFCLPPLEVVIKNVTEGVDDNSVVADHIEKIYYAYLASMANMSQTYYVYRYDYTEPPRSYESLLTTVEIVLKLGRLQNAR